MAKKAQLLNANIPEGITVPVRKAARMLDVSVSTLKRRAAEWGLRTFWDKRGRRFLIGELEATKRGLLKPIKSDVVNNDFDSLMDYTMPHGYRFRVYKTTGRNRGYIGCYCGSNIWEVEKIIQDEYGEGTYYLKLLDADYRMTGFTFTLELEDTPDKEVRNDCLEVELIESMAMFARGLSPAEKQKE